MSIQDDRLGAKQFQREARVIELTEEVIPDPKPAARIVASKAEWAELAREKAGPCRVCGTLFRIELHHLVNRSQGGDDVAENLVPLCSEHHRAVTNRDHAVAHTIRVTSSASELEYCIAKKSRAWLDEMYPGGGAEPNVMLCDRCKRPVRIDKFERIPPRKRKRWVITVPDDAEDGADVLDGLVDAARPLIAEALGYSDDVPPYYVLSAVLASWLAREGT